MAATRPCNPPFICLRVKRTQSRCEGACLVSTGVLAHRHHRHRSRQGGRLVPGDPRRVRPDEAHRDPGGQSDPDGSAPTSSGRASGASASRTWRPSTALTSRCSSSTSRSRCGARTTAGVLEDRRLRRFSVTDPDIEGLAKKVVAAGGRQRSKRGWTMRTKHTNSCCKDGQHHRDLRPSFGEKVFEPGAVLRWPGSSTVLSP